MRTDVNCWQVRWTVDRLFLDLGIFCFGLLVGLWWTLPSQDANSDLAQLFHRDLDYPKWLKFFVPLSTVDSHSGAFKYVRGSHQSASALVEDRRYSDDEVAAEYDDVCEVAVPEGTIYVADTLGIHKGQQIQSGSRHGATHLLLVRAALRLSRVCSQCEWTCQ